MKIAAVASKGGHWVQLMRLTSALEGHEVIYITTDARYGEQLGRPVIAVTDGNAKQKLRVLVMLWQVTTVMLRHRPDIVVTTGAAPGLAAVLAGRLIGARTLWIDSLANAEKLSMCGRLAKHVSTECVTQWDHLSDGRRLKYWGEVI